MSVLGKWRIVELPGYEDDYADMVEPAYILFEDGRGEFAIGCVTGAFAGGGVQAPTGAVPGTTLRRPSAARVSVPMPRRRGWRMAWPTRSSPRK